MHDHSQELEKVRKAMPQEAQLQQLSELYRCFADPTRMKILFSLFQCELCVCAIAELLDMEQSAISHQLQKLKKAKLLKSRREGKTMLYSLADAHVKTLISVGFAHIREERV